MNNKNEINLIVLQTELEAIDNDIKHIVENVDLFEKAHDEMLDEIYKDYKMGTLSFSPSDVLRSCDTTAYRCSLLDYHDSLDESDRIDCILSSNIYKSDKLQELLDKKEEIEGKIEELENDMENDNE